MSEGKFDLTAYDKHAVVSAVNQAGALSAEYHSASGARSVLTEALDSVMGILQKHILKEESAPTALKAGAIHLAGLDTQEGRKKFLTERVGINAETGDDFRIVSLTNDHGQTMLFKGRMDGNGKLTLTESVPVPENMQSPEGIGQFLESSFKPLAKPIEVKVQKTTQGAGGSTKLELSDEEKKKLQTQAAFAALAEKAKSVELVSNTRLPGKAEGAGLSLPS